MAKREEAYNTQVKGPLEADLWRPGVTYGQRMKKLAAIWVKEVEASIRRKMALGKPAAVLLLQVLAAIIANDLRETRLKIVYLVAGEAG